MKTSTEIINNQFTEIIQFVKDNHGWSKELNDSPQFKNYRKFQDDLILLDGKKVEIFFNYSNDFINSNGTKKGKIIVKDGRVLFFEGRKTTRFFYLDGGLYDGFYATLCPLKVMVFN